MVLSASMERPGRWSPPEDYHHRPPRRFQSNPAGPPQGLVRAVESVEQGVHRTQLLLVELIALKAQAGGLGEFPSK